VNLAGKTSAPDEVRPPRATPEAERVRRPTDLLFGLVSLAVILIVIGAIRALPLGSTEAADDVSHWLTHIPRFLSSAALLVSGIGCFMFAALAVGVLIRGQWRDARNAGVAALVGVGLATGTWSLWRLQGGPVATAVIHQRNPTTFVFDVAFLAFLVVTDLTRRHRWSRWCTGLTAALLVSGLATDALTPFSVVIALFGGLMTGWLMRWVLGATSARPDISQLRTWLTEHDVPVAELTPGDQQDQSRLAGRLAGGTLIDVHLANRDTRGSGIARRVWALIRLRPVVVGHVPLSSRAQLQVLALASTLAQRAAVPSPPVLLLEETPSETLVLVMARPAGEPLDGTVSPEQGTELFAALQSLHHIGVAHRDLQAPNLVLTKDDAGFASLDSAVPGASELARRLDVAQLLTTLGHIAGPAVAVRALRTGYGPVDERALAAVMQPVALASWGWSSMRDARNCMTEVRKVLLGPDAAVPAARLERFRLRTVISAALLTAAAYLLIGQLSKVDLLGTLAHISWAWFAVAVVGSALTYFAAAANLAAFVPKRLSPIRGFLVQLSSAFVGLALPPTVGHVAINARYLHKQDVDEGTIAAAVTMSQLVNVVSTVLLLVALGLLTGTGLSRFNIVPGVDVLIGVAVVGALIAIVVAIPQTRAKLTSVVWPHLRSVWPRLLDAATHPARLAVSAGANLLLTAAYLLAFFASLFAVGAHPALLPAAVVYLAGNAVGSAAPTPGGLGGVEAVLVAGLAGIGIPAHEAIPAVLVFRVATFWLPIPAGWLCYLGLERRGIL
jgi:glycosyltransferase 2 family protein